MKKLPVAERLVVAVDFKPEAGESRLHVQARVLNFVHEIADTGVCIKFNSLLRAMGYNLIDEVRACGLKVFADLKLNDIGETLARDGLFLQEASPELITVMCTAGDLGMKRLKAALPKTEVLGVTMLTNFNDADAERLFGSPDVKDAVLKFAFEAQEAGLRGLVCSPAEVSLLIKELSFEMSYTTPGIRPQWSVVKGDDQNADRVMTPAEAIKEGASRIVVGRPIVNAKDPKAAVLRTLEEIESALR
jgi:orotidine-5'-phosphate decarboxylase